MIRGRLSHRCANSSHKNPAIVVQGIRVSDLTGQTYRDAWDGLLDTGAGRSMIPDGIAAALALTPVGFAKLSPFDKALGNREYAEYDVHLSIPGIARLISLTVCASARSDVLLGRDFINMFMLLLDGPSTRWGLSHPSAYSRLLLFLLGLRG